MAKRNTVVRVGRSVRGSSVGSVASFDDVIAMAKTVTYDGFAAALESATRDHGVLHAGRHTARFTGHRVMQTQNTTLASNATWQLDDVQLLFVWRALFPMSSGKLFTGSVADGIAIVRGVRADYNRTGHGMPSGKPAIESVSYGTKRFTAPAPAPVAVASTATRKPMLTARNKMPRVRKSA